jgi:hypothetical protein
MLVIASVAEVATICRAQYCAAIITGMTALKRSSAPSSSAGTGGSSARFSSADHLAGYATSAVSGVRL